MSFSCVEKRDFGKEEKIMPIRQGENIEMEYSEGPQKKVLMKIHQMEEYEYPYPYIEMTKGVEVTFYDSLSTPEAHITANYAKKKVNENEVILKSQVVITNNSNQKLETEYLEWHQSKGKVFSDKFVRITDGDEVISGVGFEANDDLSEYRIKKIKGVISNEEIVN